MTLRTDLVAVLQTVVPRVFPSTAPMNTLRPYATVQRIGGDAVAYIDDTIPSTVNAMVQVEIWSSSRLEADALAAQAEVAITTATVFQGRPVAAAVDTHDEDLGLHGSRQDFTIWADR